MVEEGNIIEIDEMVESFSGVHQQGETEHDVLDLRFVTGLETTRSRVCD